jgi:hypothetical protein
MYVIAVPAAARHHHGGWSSMAPSARPGLGPVHLTAVLGLLLALLAALPGRRRPA